MTELTADALDAAIKRYLRSKSKGGPDSGTYQQAARTALQRWREWLADMVLSSSSVIPTTVRA